MTEMRLIIAILLVAVSGCANSPYRAKEIPPQYAAQPVRDYSLVDLTPYASQATRQDAIQPGDRLQVTLDPGTLEKESQRVWHVSVDESGNTTLPNIGAIQVAGLTSSEAESSIVRTSLQRDVFLTPVVEVQVAARNGRTILVSGAVGSPGPVPITKGSVSLADVIVRAGGITNKASGIITVSAAAKEASAASATIPNAILPIGHTTVEPITVSLEKTSEQKIGQIMVPEGSIVHVETIGPRPIKVVGVIRNQVVEVPSGQNVRLLDAVTMAGGQTYSNWISDKVTITRHVSDGSGTVRIRGSIRKARADSQENILLAPYDIVTIEENPITFTLSTLSGLFGAGVNAARLGGI